MTTLPLDTDTRPPSPSGVSGLYAEQNASADTVAAFLDSLRSYRGPRGMVVAVQTLARDIGMSERTVQRARATAVRLNLLVVIIQGGPPRSQEWHESRTNVYVIRGETRRERRWRRPYHEREKSVFPYLAPYLSARPALEIRMRFLIAQSVDNNEFFDPVALVEECDWPGPRREHEVADSGYCVWCGERIL